MRFDKSKPPFKDSIAEWEDFCDCMNNEGKYANSDPTKLKYCKNYFFITTNGKVPNIDTLPGISLRPEVSENPNFFQRLLSKFSK